MRSISGKKGFLLTSLFLTVMAVIGCLDYRLFQFLHYYIILVIIALVYILTTKANRYLKEDNPLFIGQSLLIVGIVNLVEFFFSYNDFYHSGLIKSMAHSGVILLETFTLIGALFFIKRKFSRISWVLSIMAVIIIDIILVQRFGDTGAHERILGFGCGVIVLIGIGYFLARRRQFCDLIYDKLGSAMVLLSISSFLGMEYVPIITLGFLPNLLRLWAYVLIYQGVISTSYESLFHELKESILIDELTGLYNRQGLMEFAKKEMARAEREGWYIGILMMDLDRFKYINDRHGHLVGDRIIQQFADILKDSVRETDILCRLGGDEFIVLLSGEEPNFSLIRDRILEAVEKWKAENKLAAKIGVSIGISVKEPGSHKRLEEIIKEADLYMYREKNKKKPLKTLDESNQYKIFS